MKISRAGILAATAPSVLMLLAFYTLAFHMYKSLGGWPTSIGEQGFSSILVVHSTLTVWLFIAALYAAFLTPLPILACLATREWRKAAPYFVLHGALFFVCWELMQLAPEPFLYWWRD